MLGVLLLERYGTPIPERSSKRRAIIDVLDELASRRRRPRRSRTPSGVDRLDLQCLDEALHLGLSYGLPHRPSSRPGRRGSR